MGEGPGGGRDGAGRAATAQGARRQRNGANVSARSSRRRERAVERARAQRERIAAATIAASSRNFPLNSDTSDLSEFDALIKCKLKS